MTVILPIVVGFVLGVVLTFFGVPPLAVLLICGGVGACIGMAAS